MSSFDPPPPPTAQEQQNRLPTYWTHRNCPELFPQAFRHGNSMWLTNVVSFLQWLFTAFAGVSQTVTFLCGWGKPGNTEQRFPYVVSLLPPSSIFISRDKWTRGKHFSCILKGARDPCACNSHGGGDCHPFPGELLCHARSLCSHNYKKSTLCVGAGSVEGSDVTYTNPKGSFCTPFPWPLSLFMLNTRTVWSSEDPNLGQVTLFCTGHQ